MKSSSLTALVAVTAISASSAAQAQVLYSDTFSRISGISDATATPPITNGLGDWGTNDNGLGGTLSAAYQVGPQRTGGANQSVNGSAGLTINGGVFLNINAAASAPAGFTVAFAFDRFDGPSENGTGNGFLAIGLGRPSLLAGVETVVTDQLAIANNDASLLFQQAVGTNVGNGQIFQDGVLLPGQTTQGLFDYGNPLADHSVLITFTPATAGAYGDTDVINASIQVDGGTAVNFAVLGGADFGNLSFSSNQTVFRGYDNLVVTAVPEPTSLAAIGLAGAAALRRRRRA